MSKPSKYLMAAIPTAEKSAEQTGNSADDERLAVLESRLEELNQLLIKQQRDEQDARDNIDEENLSESLLKRIQDLEARVTTLEEENENP